ncbi:hypothetical protein EV126DRAFT_417634 [Verticillium dahliae]|nr:hypothetical protein EV126DRAFT_435363 [Verticillium dahliae]KAH6702207.1 hypothetical protein EV126DRAFT_417634 [Verticillium dahliae]
MLCLCVCIYSLIGSPVSAEPRTPNCQEATAKSCAHHQAARQHSSTSSPSTRHAPKQTFEAARCDRPGPRTMARRFAR